MHYFDQLSQKACVCSDVAIYFTNKADLQEETRHDGKESNTANKTNEPQVAPSL